MAESGSYNLGLRLDIKQILSEAQHRWLRPAEISEILRNYQKFCISSEAPNKPVSGSVFLFDRKVLRYFRKDGHNWRKKKDGKTIKEAHEKLKVGSVDMLHCYYAHGEDNENFQRRSYWLLEQDLMHIVFVHYLEVKGNKSSIGYVRNSDAVISNSENDSSLSSSFRGTSPTSTLSSACEEAESEDNHQASSRFHAYPESPLLDDSHSALSGPYTLISSSGNRDGDFSGSSLPPQVTVGLASWQNVLGSCTSTGEIAYKPEPIQAQWQQSPQGSGQNLYSPDMGQNLISNLLHDRSTDLFEEKSILLEEGNNSFYTWPDELKEQYEQRNMQMLLTDAETRNAMNPNLENGMTAKGNENYSFLLKKPLTSGIQADESLKKVDSFSRWMAKELLDADELTMQSSNGISWSLMGGEYDSSMPAQLEVDAETLSPSVAQDQLFSIIDFSPNWVYSNLGTKVLVTGSFLKSMEELSKCRWSIMFGELEVRAVVLAQGILCCDAPSHKPGVVPFYVTCSNRLACSEIREFEYRSELHQNISDVDEIKDSVILMHLYHRFEMILGMQPVSNRVSSAADDFEKQNVMHRVISLIEEENNQEDEPTPKNDASYLNVIGKLLIEKHLKQKFYSWLLFIISEYGKGPTVVDEGGQSVLHLAAALGFNWAVQPIIASGVSIDFRDVNGWTALHWAAFYGREKTVAALVSLGAAPGALTDPTAEHPLGRTPWDLASSSGHKGISGFLAETSLTKHLSTLRMNETEDGGTTGVPDVKAIQTISERLAVPGTGEDVPDTLSLKDSLAAVCNATQAAARIHQIFRIQSFQRKQFIEQGSDELCDPDEKAISLVSAKTSRFGQSDGMFNAAAVRIQKKFRGWKKRKEFLLIRQKIVKIQAHVRGHQVRKKYKPIVWSVGILEKVILRWRRKGTGLRGFRSDCVLKSANAEGTSTQEDDYDFLKEGRKQTEERMQKALARVTSMAQHPEARAQYRRLLTAAEGFRESKDTSDMIPGDVEDTIYTDEDLIDVEALLDDDTFMSLAFEGHP